VFVATDGDLFSTEKRSPSFFSANCRFLFLCVVRGKDLACVFAKISDCLCIRRPGADQKTASFSAREVAGFVIVIYSDNKCGYQANGSGLILS